MTTRRAEALAVVPDHERYDWQVRHGMDCEGYGWIPMIGRLPRAIRNISCLYLSIWTSALRCS
jgi:hypothetical protein